MTFHRLAAACALTLAALMPAAHAAPLPTDGSWAVFTVDANLPPYSTGWADDNGAPLQFDVSIEAGFVGTLTVVDTGFSGDQFKVLDGQQVLGTTSTPVSGDPSGAITFDADVALANTDFSRGVYTLAAGSHRISGLMVGSLANADGPLNATIGAVRLQVSAVPEPASLATLLAGLGLLAVVRRRRTGSH